MNHKCVSTKKRDAVKAYFSPVKWYSVHFITQKVKTKSLLCITQYLSSWQPRLPLYEWIHLVKLACSILTLKIKTTNMKSDARDLGAPIKHDPPRLQGFITAWHKCVCDYSVFISTGENGEERDCSFGCRPILISILVLVEYPLGTWLIFL